MNLQEKIIAFAVGVLMLSSVALGYGSLFAQPNLTKPLTELPGIKEGDQPGTYSFPALPEAASVEVPAGSEDAPQAGKQAPATPPVRYPLNLNTATARQLETLPGIGPVLAQRIIEFRASRGKLASVDELLQVKGIGQKKLAAIRDLVVVK